MEWFNHSKLFEMARQGKRLTHVAAVIPLAGVFTIVGQMGVIPLVVALGLIYGFSEAGVNMPKDLPPVVSGFWMAMELTAGFGLIYVILWAWLRFFEKRPFRTMGYGADGLRQYGRGLLLGGLMFAGAVGILALTGAAKVEQGDPAQEGFAALSGILLVLLGWVVQGGAEEALLRGWVLPVVGARYRPWLGLVVSSLIFAALHGLNNGISAIALVNLALFGVFAGLYAMREGSLWGISAVHTVWNWVQGNIFGLAVSGSNPAGGTLVNLATKGPDWLTGGAFGPEGGAAVTIVLAVGIAAVLAWKGNATPAESDNIVSAE